MSEPPAARKLVLASRSPQRIRLLTDAQFEFIAQPADIDEDNYPPELLPSENSDAPGPRQGGGGFTSISK